MHTQSHRKELMRYIIDTIVQDVLYLGYKQIVMNSDNELAIV